MPVFDTVLKNLFQQFGERTLERLTGMPIARWLPTDLPKVQNLRVDLLGETAAGELVHLEVQVTNDSGMALRMLEYAVGIARLHGSLPKQLVLYIGREPLKMPSEIRWSGGIFGYALIDIREIDGEPLLASPQPSDNVFAILARLPDQRRALREILRNLSGLPADQRDTYLETLLILAGLRGLATAVEGGSIGCADHH